MENKCEFCEEDLGNGPIFNGYDKGKYHLDCHSLINKVETMSREELIKISKIINTILIT